MYMKTTMKMNDESLPSKHVEDSTRSRRQTQMPHPPGERYSPQPFLTLAFVDSFVQVLTECTIFYYLKVQKCTDVWLF
jgi:hypothetical protein